MKKNENFLKMGLFSSFQSGFPSAVELCSSQKIVNRHGFFPGLLHLCQVDETVRQGDFKVFFVVGDHATWCNTRCAALYFTGIDFQIDGLAVFGQKLGVGSRVGRQTANMVVHALAVAAPIHVAKLF